jgi:hypothetical protein
LAVTIFAVLFLLVGLPGLRSQAIDWRSPVARHETRDFQQFLTNHPWIANKLRENPLLDKVFGSTVETWLWMQLAFDLAAGRKEESKIKVRRKYFEELYAN